MKKIFYSIIAAAAIFTGCNREIILQKGTGSLAIDLSCKSDMNEVQSKATDEDITSISDFEGKTVAFESSSAGQTYVDGIAANVNKKGVSAQMDALLSVKAGTADFAVVDVLLAQSVAGKDDYASLAINEGIEIPGEYYAVGFKKGSELTSKINELFVKYAEDGYLVELATKYGLQNSIITDYGK